MQVIRFDKENEFDKITQLRNEETGKTVIKKVKEGMEEKSAKNEE